MKNETIFNLTPDEFDRAADRSEPVTSHQAIKPLNPLEFNQLIEKILAEDYGQLTLEQFCAAMDAINGDNK